MEEAAVRAAHLREHEARGALGGNLVRGAPQHARPLGQRGDHEAVPVGQHLVVLERVHPGLARGEEARARRLPARFDVRFGDPQFPRPGRERPGEVQDVRPGRLSPGFLAVVALGGHVEDRFPEGGLVGSERRAQLRPRPDVEPAFHAFAVRVLGREETALGRGHVAQHVGEDLLRGPAEGRLARDLAGGQRGECGQGLVVEHFLEVGDEPLGVGRVAVDPVSDVVPDAAQAHGGERALDHLERPGVAGAVVDPQQEEQAVRGRELGGGLEAAVARVEAEGDVVVGAVEQPQSRRLGRGVGEGAAEALGDAGGRGGHALRFQRPELAHALAELDQPLAAEAGAAREVGGREEGPPVRGHEDRERPAAAAGHHLADGHVHRVDVGPLLAVHLDADEGRVQCARGLLVLERLPLHDVAPVAGGVADGEEDRLVLGRGPGEGLVRPGIPVHGVVGVLQQVGAFFVRESVGRHAASPVTGSDGAGLPGRRRRTALKVGTKPAQGNRTAVRQYGGRVVRRRSSTGWPTVKW